MSIMSSLEMEILGQKFDAVEFVAITDSVQTTSPRVHMMNMMTDSNLEECAHSLGAKSHIVHKYWTTATILTALIPFCLSTFPQSCSLSMIAEIEAKPSLREARS